MTEDQLSIDLQKNNNWMRYFGNLLNEDLLNEDLPKPALIPRLQNEVAS